MAEVMFNTYDTPHLTENLDHPTLRGKKIHTRQYSMWRHFSGIATARTIIIAGGVASASPGLVAPFQTELDVADNSTSTAGGKAIWYSTNVNQTVTTAEGVIFVNAGYIVDGREGVADYVDGYSDTY